jgi:hypothetical protein
MDTICDCGRLQAIGPSADPLKDLVEGRLATVIESARFRVGLSVCFSRSAIVQNDRPRFKKWADAMAREDDRSLAHWLEKMIQAEHERREAKSPTR